MNSTETKTRESICRLGASTFGRGLTPGSSGNISVRVDDGWLMTPTNASLGALDPATLSKLDGQGRLISGEKETKESFLHLAVYDARANASASAPLKELQRKFGFTPDSIVTAAKEQVAQGR